MTTPQLDTLVLAKGNHTARENGVCLMEAVAWFAGEPHTDRPECVSVVLRNFGINLNDNWDDTARQKLVPVIPLTISTAGDGHDEARGYMALDWLIRTYTPAWLDLAGLSVEAQALRDLRRIVDLTAAQSAGPVVKEARAKASAARAAAGAAARAAAGAAARDAAGAAARAAARDAARAAARDAARAAARAAARDAARAAARAAAGAAARAAAWDAAWAAAWDAAGDAAGDAAWAAAGAAARDAAGDAARDAAGDVLAPTVVVLQDSAVELFRDMCLIGKTNPEQETK